MCIRDSISIHYDPMIAKLCAHGMDRTQALERLRRAIDEYTIHGVETTLEFGRFVLDHAAFTSGKFDTGFVSTHFDETRFSSYIQARRDGGHWTAVTTVLEHETATTTSDAVRSARTNWRTRHTE